MSQVEEGGVDGVPLEAEARHASAAHRVGIRAARTPEWAASPNRASLLMMMRRIMTSSRERAPARDGVVRC